LSLETEIDRHNLKSKKMKRKVQVTGILLMLLLSCNMSLSAQRGMKHPADSTRMSHMRLDRGMRHDYNMRRGYGPMQRDSISARQFGPAGMILGSIPNVTEAQKKQITDLMTKQRSEMQKLREEMQTKMQALRDSHRKSVLNVLTEEQKKFVETREKDNPPARGISK
jgi:Spy/CpxP family protein refolding chaperone